MQREQMHLMISQIVDTFPFFGFFDSVKHRNAIFPLLHKFNETVRKTTTFLDIEKKNQKKLKQSVDDCIIIWLKCQTFIEALNACNRNAFERSGLSTK